MASRRVSKRPIVLDNRVEIISMTWPTALYTNCFCKLRLTHFNKPSFISETFIIAVTSRQTLPGKNICFYLLHDHNLCHNLQLKSEHRSVLMFLSVASNASFFIKAGMHYFVVTSLFKSDKCPPPPCKNFHPNVQRRVVPLLGDHVTTWVMWTLLLAAQWSVLPGSRRPTELVMLLGDWWGRVSMGTSAVLDNRSLAPMRDTDGRFGSI